MDKRRLCPRKPNACRFKQLVLSYFAFQQMSFAEDKRWEAIVLYITSFTGRDTRSILY